ncbi:Aste57867_19835 [Aphanomyces stellatus]|uniref:Aste57867_19835 protein n=1 Tax=Aphanomyces stellatus TaxID=120398 RepID=A0A485LF17_9STRA|nr:hypothetical protein As57867_019770 [Aphanomyces stellatus]VFT96533.1 Aste57867_19835 [Aphanomyces stellatus]
MAIRHPLLHKQMTNAANAESHVLLHSTVCYSMGRLCMCMTIVALLGQDAHARASYVARIPNGDNVPGFYAIGHSNDQGGSTNHFGSDYGVSGAWTAALCQKDSDGDGQTNGQELGDPCCAWTQGTPPNQTSGLSHPGLASSKRDPALISAVNCTGVPTTTTNAAQSSVCSVLLALVVSSALILCG